MNRTPNLGDGLMHLIKSVALIGVAIGLAFALTTMVIVLGEHGSLTAQEMSDIGAVINWMLLPLIAIFAWAIIEFLLALWSINRVRIVVGQVQEAIL